MKTSFALFSLFFAYHGVNADMHTADNTCSTIAEIACAENSGFSTLCAAVTAADLGEALSTGTFTVFAPTDDAFAALPSGTLNDLLKPENKDALTDILLFHAVADKVVKKCSLRCDGMVEMANGKSSTTECSEGKKFQTGAGNGANNMPEIVATDVMACNGVIHVISQVMLP